MTQPQNFVGSISEGAIMVSNVSSALKSRLRRLGGRPTIINQKETWIIETNDQEEILCELLEQLRDLGVLFAGAPGGWSPSEIFLYLRDKKLISGQFQEVLWRMPDDWFIQER